MVFVLPCVVPLVIILLIVFSQICDFKHGTCKWQHGSGGGPQGNHPRTGNVLLEVNTSVPIATIDEVFVCATMDWWPSSKCDYGTCAWGNASLLNLVSYPSGLVPRYFSKAYESCGDAVWSCFMRATVLIRCALHFLCSGLSLNDTWPCCRPFLSEFGIHMATCISPRHKPSGSISDENLKFVSGDVCAGSCKPIIGASS